AEWIRDGPVDVEQGPGGHRYSIDEQWLRSTQFHRGQDREPSTQQSPERQSVSRLELGAETTDSEKKATVGEAVGRAVADPDAMRPHTGKTGHLQSGLQRVVGPARVLCCGHESFWPSENGALNSLGHEGRTIRRQPRLRGMLTTLDRST